MEYWEYVSQVPHDGDTTYLDEVTPGSFNVALTDLSLAPGERVAAVAAAVCWRNAGTGYGRVRLQTSAGNVATTDGAATTTYDTVFAFARSGPATGRPWTQAQLNSALVGAFVISGSGLRATQVGLHVLLVTPPVEALRPKEGPMNFQALEPVTATGSDQAVEVPRGATLVVHPLAASVEVRHVTGGTARLTIPADSLVMLGPSYGQTVYLRAVAGTVIELGLT